MTPRSRLLHGTVAALVVALLVAPTAAARPTPAPDIGEQRAHVDPALLARSALAPAPALLSWDPRATSREQVRAFLAERGLAHHAFTMLPMAVVCAGGRADVAALARAPGAVSVWGDEAMEPTLDGSVRTAFNGDPEEVWSGLGITGQGVGIAVLDTGIDGTHPDLTYGTKTKLNARVVVSHWEIFGPGEDTCVPDHVEEGLEDSESLSGHGTHLASVAAGSGAASGGRLRGVAPGADLVGVSILEQWTPQYDGDVRLSLIRFIAGVEYVLSSSLDVGPTVTKVALLGWTSPGLFDPLHPHYLSVRDLDAFGISVVMPVGNGGPQPSHCDSAETCRFNRFAVGGYPIGVGATPKDSRTVLEGYSSRGDPTERTVRGQLVRYEPTLVAPGSQVVAARRRGLATYGTSLPGPYPLAGSGEGLGDDPLSSEYQSLTGTSAAAAHVAGVVALMQQAAVEAKGCFLTPAQVQEILVETSTPMPSYGRWEVGAGAVDATAAVFAARLADRLPSVDPWMCPPA